MSQKQQHYPFIKAFYGPSRAMHSYMSASELTKIQRRLESCAID